MHRGESNGATAAFTAAAVDFARAPAITGRMAARIFDNIAFGWRGAMSTVDGTALSLATSGTLEAALVEISDKSGCFRICSKSKPKG